MLFECFWEPSETANPALKFAYCSLVRSSSPLSWCFWGKERKLRRWEEIGGRSGSLKTLAGAQRVWEHNACVQPTSSAVLAGAGKQGNV